MRKGIRPRGLAQEMGPSGSKSLRRLEELGAVVVMTKADVTGRPLSDLTVGGVKMQVSPVRSVLQENCTVPLYP